MKKLMFLFLMVMGLLSSLYALDTGQIGCDVEKSPIINVDWNKFDKDLDGIIESAVIATDKTLHGAECNTILPPGVTYTLLEARHNTTQAYLDNHIITVKDFKLLLKHEAIATLLYKVDICIINGGYSKYMGEGGV